MVADNQPNRRIDINKIKDEAAKLDGAPEVLETITHGIDAQSNIPELLALLEAGTTVVHLNRESDGGYVHQIESDNIRYAATSEEKISGFNKYL